MTVNHHPFDKSKALSEQFDIEFVLQTAGVGLWEFIPKTNEVIWDDRCRQFFGLAEGNSISYQQAIQYIHPQDLIHVNQAVHWAMDPKSGGDYDQTHRTIGADDSKLRWVRFQGKCSFTQTGEVQRFSGVARDVTGLLIAEDNHRQVLSLINQSPAGIAVIDKEGLTFRMVNSIFSSIIGRSQQQLIGKSLLEAVPELRGQGLDHLLGQVINTGEPHVASETKANIIRSGELELMYADYHFQPQRDPSGTVTGVLILTVDVTQQVMARQKLAESEARFRTLVEQAPVSTCLFVGDDFKIEVVNEAMLSYWGRDKSVIGKPLLDALPELKGQPHLDILKQVYKTGETYQAHQSPATLIVDGRPRKYYFDLIHKPLRNSQGQVYAIMDMSIDVTDQVIAHKELRESEARFRSLIEQAPVACCLFVSRELRIDIANQMMLGAWGKDPSVLGRPLGEAVPELKGQPFLSILDDIFTNGQPYSSKDARVKLEVDGVLGTYYFDFTYKPMFNSAGEVYGIMNMAVDVTEQVLAREGLKESETRFRTMAEASAIMIAVGDQSSSATYFNKAWVELTGRPMQQLIDFGWVDRVHPDDKERYVNIYLDAFKIKGSFEGEFRVLNTLDEYRWLLAQGRPRFDDEGTFLGYISACTDITERKQYQFNLENEVQQRTEALAAANEELASSNEELAAINEEYVSVNEELNTANRLLSRSNESLQQFAYVASHDLQEPLRKVQAFGDLLINRYGTQLGDGKDYVARMQAATIRMSVLIEDLLTFSKVSTTGLATEPVPLAKVIDSSLALLELIIEQTQAEIKVDKLPVVVGDQSQLEQLFTNLISNALKFCKPASVPKVGIYHKIVKKTALPKLVKPPRASALYHRIDVVDNGIGFNEKYAERIFQVFQRLHDKNEFAGTGIGLAICEKVAANHGGAITATSQPGLGSRFSIFFPL